MPMSFPTLKGAKIILSPQGGVQIRHWHPHPTPSSVQRIQKFLQQSSVCVRREGDHIYHVTWLEDT
jgi:hypothetical protein